MTTRIRDSLTDTPKRRWAQTTRTLQRSGRNITAAAADVAIQHHKQKYPNASPEQWCLNCEGDVRCLTDAGIWILLVFPVFPYVSSIKHARELTRLRTSQADGRRSEQRAASSSVPQRVTTDCRESRGRGAEHRKIYIVCNAFSAQEGFELHTLHFILIPLQQLVIWYATSLQREHNRISQVSICTSQTPPSTLT